MADIYGKDSDGRLVKKWAGQSRSAQLAKNNLGIVQGGDLGTPKFRRQCLEDYDAVYERRQYDGLIPWDAAAQKACEDGDYVGVRKRQPRINLPFAKMLSSRIVAKILGEDTFPKITVDQDPDTTAFIKAILDWSDLKSRMLEPARRMLNTGSVFVRFAIMGGTIKVEHFLSKYCYPQFDSAGELTEVRIQYVYTDYADIDERGKPREKWYRMDLGQSIDTLYDNPPYSSEGTPDFQVVSSVQHDLGFVQGTWFRTCEDKHNPDGYSMAEDISDIIDEINYSISQSSQAVSYNQEPQLTVSGMDTEELDHIVKSSQKALNLGRDGKASYLETTMGGVETAMKLQDKARLWMQDFSRVVMLDPEKIATQAQSGRAMELLHGPMVDLIKELRPAFKKGLVELITKMAVTILALEAQGVELGMEIPPGWQPSSLSLSFNWPPVFPMTLEDLQKKVALTVAASAGRVISEESATRFIGPDLNVEDIEAEIAKIKAQPIANPFGGF